MHELVPFCTPKTVLSYQTSTQTNPTRLIDVRKPEARARSGERIAGSTWIDPAALSPSHPVFADQTPLIFFCVHGHEVSTYACALARYVGRDATMVTGGFQALVEAGAKTEPLA